MEHRSLVDLYREVFPEAGRLIKRLGGNPEEAKDVFHDALLIYLEREAKGTLQIHTSAKAYLLGTAKILWFHSKNQYSDSLPEDVEVFVEEENEAADEEKNVFHYLLLAGQKCLHMLKAFYYDNLSLSQIAASFGFSGVRSATVQKHKCIEKIRTELKKEIYMRNDLIEVEQIEKYLSHQMSGEEKSQFETRMLIDGSLFEKVTAQKDVHKLIRIFSRRQQRNKLELIYRQLLREHSFLQQLKNIFA